MGKPSLILAALAADALPGLRFSQVQDLTQPGEEIVTQVLTTDQGQQILLKSPKSALALTKLGLEVRALRVLGKINMPFRVPALLGETSPKAVYKAYAFDYVSGNQLDARRLKAEDPITSKLGQTLAQIHSIPANLIADAGLPESDPALRVRERVAEFDRAMETGRIHPDLLERWQNALLDLNLFRYQPCVVHGALDSEYILTEGDEIVGINNWTNLSIDDPAVDLAAFFGECSPEIAEAIVLSYEGSIRTDRNIRQRANLYVELSLAGYLLQAVESEDEAGIAEAQGYLDNLHTHLLEGQLPSLNPSELVNGATEVVTPISQAASFTGPITIVTEQLEIVEEEIDPEEPKA
ncbi:MAG: phosphotransferase [Rhodoluna sp.]